LTGIQYCKFVFYVVVEIIEKDAREHDKLIRIHMHEIMTKFDGRRWNFERFNICPICKLASSSRLSACI
jgi:hypothetical protein